MVYLDKSCLWLQHSGWALLSHKQNNTSLQHLHVKVSLSETFTCHSGCSSLHPLTPDTQKWLKYFFSPQCRKEWLEVLFLWVWMGAEVIMDVFEWHLLLEMANHSFPAPHIIPVVYIQKMWGREAQRPEREQQSRVDDVRPFPNYSSLYII